MPASRQVAVEQDLRGLDQQLLQDVSCVSALCPQLLSNTPPEGVQAMGTAATCSCVACHCSESSPVQHAHSAAVLTHAIPAPTSLLSGSHLCQMLNSPVSPV